MPIPPEISRVSKMHSLDEAAEAVRQAGEALTGINPQAPTPSVNELRDAGAKLVDASTAISNASAEVRSRFAEMDEVLSHVVRKISALEGTTTPWYAPDRRTPD